MPPTEKKSILTGPEYGFTVIESRDNPDVLMLGQGQVIFFDIPEMDNQRKENGNTTEH